MLAKLIVWAENRGEAIVKMDALLRDFVLLGVRHNLDFLRSFIESKPFQTGKYHTHSVAALLPEYLKKRAEGAKALQTLVTQIPLSPTRILSAAPKSISELPSGMEGFRNA
jgi:acetyl/propionyl-CoA carboxylase alpha subunit